MDLDRLDGHIVQDFLHGLIRIVVAVLILDINRGVVCEQLLYFYFKGFFQTLCITCCIFDLLSIDIYIRGIDLDLNVLLDDRAFLYSALVLLLAAASAAGQDILIDFPDFYPVVSADEDRIRQVLINLVSNAVKYAPQGNITL